MESLQNSNDKRLKVFITSPSNLDSYLALPFPKQLINVKTMEKLSPGCLEGGCDCLIDVGFYLQHFTDNNFRTNTPKLSRFV